VYVLFIGLPLIALFVRSIGGEGFLESLTRPVVLQALKLSAITGTISLAITVVIGTPFAYFLARSDSRALRVVDSLVELPIVLPPVVAGVAMLMAFGRRGLLGPTFESAGFTIPFTTIAVVFSQVFVSAPFYIRAAKLGFQGVERDFEDVSQTLGVSAWKTFWRVTLPLAGPGLLAGAALAWARALSEFGATIMFAGNFMGKTQTLPLAIMSAMESDIPAALALSTIVVLGAVLVLVAIGLAARSSHWRRL
jgi:molybdate transport system permease protein